MDTTLGSTAVLGQIEATLGNVGQIEAAPKVAASEFTNQIEKGNRLVPWLRNRLEKINRYWRFLLSLLTDKVNRY